jgi:transposase
VIRRVWDGTAGNESEQDILVKTSATIWSVWCGVEGVNNRAIADVVGVTRQTVRTWRERFAKHRLDGLDDEPRSGAPRKIGDDRIEQIITGTLETKSAGRDTLEHAQHGEELVKELIAAIEEFINQRNAAPKPLRWTKSADDILASFERFCRRTLDAYAPNG